MSKWNSLYKYLLEEKEQLEALIREDDAEGNHNNYTDMMAVHVYALNDIMAKMRELDVEDEEDTDVS